MLITGFGYQCNPATEKIAKEVISDFRGRKFRRIFGRMWPVAAGVCAIVILSGLFFAKSTENRAAREAIPVSDKQDAVVVPAPAPAQDLSVPQAPTVCDAPSNAQPQISEVAAPEQIKPVTEAKAPATAEIQPLREEAPPQIADEQKYEPLPTTVPLDQSKEMENGIAARTVIKGDSVSQILVAIYGYCTPELIRLFQEANPQIKDPNKITVGEQLQLPRLNSPKRSTR